MPIYRVDKKIKDITYNKQVISKGYYGGTLVYNKLDYESMFFMRFHNQTGSTVTVSGLNMLFTTGNGYTTGNPQLLYAVVEHSGQTDNVKGIGNTIINFTVADGELCVLIFGWSGGLFSLQMNNPSYNSIIYSAGCKIKGNYDIPNMFMTKLFYNCQNYTQEAGDVFDMNDLHPTTIGSHFLYNTWYDCFALITAVAPLTTNWNITTIGDSFMNYTWGGCISLITAVVPDTTNWNVTTIGSQFMIETWVRNYSLQNAVSIHTTNWNVTTIGSQFLFNTWATWQVLKNVVLPDTTNWNVTTIGSHFLYNTLNSPIFQNGITVTLKGSLYTGIFPLYSNSLGLYITNVTNIKVDTGLITTYQNSASWSTVPDNKFISW